MDEHTTPPHDGVIFTAAEIKGIEEAPADFEARGGIPNEEVTAWLDGLDADGPLAEPQPRKF